MVPTATDATDEDNLQYMKRQLAANCNGKVPTSVRFLKSQQDRAASNPRRIHLHYCEWDDEPLPVFAGMGLQQATTFQMLNRRCKAFRLHPTHRNKVCKNCCQFGHPTNTCIKDARCAYCGQNHHHSDHGKFCKASGVTYQPLNSLPTHTIFCCLCNKKTDHHTFDPKCPTYLDATPHHRAMQHHQPMTTCNHECTPSTATTGSSPGENPAI
ncbi:hypothetical protein PCASD_25894 [Puccinia coronata f. sp. avenae]|uniref:Uncharacterized protein n=1 Tax=Puccinia coronata f. sp. avenae TaxID=200324 RepID=A0A2N5TH61_9BASI|nr:hypothetical protein PCASD_25894 [Puccinia coronata f. sp. avenae]